jgi:hypothetical protein
VKNKIKIFAYRSLYFVPELVKFGQDNTNASSSNTGSPSEESNDLKLKRIDQSG